METPTPEVTDTQKEIAGKLSPPVQEGTEQQKHSTHQDF